MFRHRSLVMIKGELLEVERQIRVERVLRLLGDMV